MSAALAVPLCAQQERPKLLRRAADADETTLSGVYVPGRTNLPDEASGSYALNPDGNESIEIILNAGSGEARLQGYVTRMGESTWDRGTPLTFFFSRTTISGSQISFITRQVHGVWWSFNGSIDRGSAQMSTQKGFYFLNGDLTEHFDTGQKQLQRVSLPLLPAGQSVR